MRPRWCARAGTRPCSGSSIASTCWRCRARKCLPSMPKPLAGRDRRAQDGQLPPLDGGDGARHHGRLPGGERAGGLRSAGRSMGMQLIGRPRADAEVLSAAAAYEQALGDRRRAAVAPCAATSARAAAPDSRARSRGLSALPSRLRIASRIWRARCTSISSGTFTELPKSGPVVARGRPSGSRSAFCWRPPSLAAALVALHGLLHLLHHVLGAPAQRFQRAALLADGLGRLGPRRARVSASPIASPASPKPSPGCMPMPSRPSSAASSSPLQLALALLQLLHRLGEFLRRHPAGPGPAGRLLPFAGCSPCCSPRSWPRWRWPRCIWSMRKVSFIISCWRRMISPSLSICWRISALLAVLALLLSAGLQIVHHVLQLRQQLLRLVAVARLGEVLDLVHQPVEVALAQLLAVAASARRGSGSSARARRTRAGTRSSPGAAPSSSLSISSSLAPRSQRLLQRLLRLAQPLLGGRQVAVLDPTARSPRDRRRRRAAGRRSRPS